MHISIANVHHSLVRVGRQIPVPLIRVSIHNIPFGTRSYTLYELIPSTRPPLLIYDLRRVFHFRRIKLFILFQVDRFNFLDSIRSVRKNIVMLHHIHCQILHRLSAGCWMRSLISLVIKQVFTIHASIWGRCFWCRSSFSQFHYPLRAWIWTGCNRIGSPTVSGCLRSLPFVTISVTEAWYLKSLP